MTDLSGILQLLMTLTLVLSAQITLVLLLRKPVRVLLGSIACYRLWLVTLLWLPAYMLGDSLLQRWQTLYPREEPLQNAEGFQLLLKEWVLGPLENLGNVTVNNTFTLIDVREIAALLWLAGSCAVIGWQLYKYRVFSRLIRLRARPVPHTDSHAVDVRSVFGSTLPALVLSGMNSAALFGIRKPVLLLPESFADHYDSDQQHIILAHEAVHLRRKDNAWNLCAGLLVALNWPNPLFWLAWRYFRLDQELSCDALALTSCNHTQQKRYARTLLDAASIAPGAGPQPMLSAWGHLNDLKERTLMITEHLKNKASPLLVRCCLSLIAIAGSLAMIVASDSFNSVSLAAEPDQANTIDEKVGAVLRDTIELLNADKLDEARAKLSVLDLESLTPYERSRAEQMLFSLDVNAQNYAGARKHMEESLASGGMTDQEAATGRYQLAQLWLQEEKWVEGAAAIEEWLTTASAPNGGVYYLLAAAYYNLKQYDRAIPQAETAVAIGGNQSKEAWWQMLSALYLQTEQYEKALPVLREQVKLFPDKDVYQKQLAALERTLQEL